MKATLPARRYFFEFGSGIEVKGKELCPTCNKTNIWVQVYPPYDAYSIRSKKGEYPKISRLHIQDKKETGFIRCNAREQCSLADVLEDTEKWLEAKNVYVKLT